jgi:tetratricopeptide (TPR) repeat protein
MENKTKAFLSYARDDLATVVRIYEGLVARGIAVWFDQEHLGPGKWRPQITRAIAKSRFFIICLSEAALRKTGDAPGFIDTELDQAYNIALAQSDADFTIIPIRLEDCNRGDHRLTMYQQFDLFSDWGGALDRLAVMLGGHSLSAVVAAAPTAPEQRQIDRLHGKAAAFFFAGDFKRAFDTWNEVEALGGRSAISLMNKGLTLFQTDRLDEAIAAFDEALSIDAEFYPAWANKGAALAKAGRSSEAIEAYGKALEIKPELAPLHWVIGESLGVQGQDREALAHLSRAVALSPDLVRA